jgi:hypothetical protein
MEQIADWLARLGMSEYAERFKQNGITIAALPHLTDQDLKEIGVLLGHRRVMLAAINTMGNAARVVAEPASVPERRPQDTAERRHVTVSRRNPAGAGSAALHRGRTDREGSQIVGQSRRAIISAIGTCRGG